MRKLLEWAKQYFKAGDPQWTVRRRIVILLISLGVGCVIYAVGWEHETERARSLWRDAFDFIKWVSTTYIVTATGDDVLRRRPPAVVAATQQEQR